MDDGELNGFSFLISYFTSGNTVNLKLEPSAPRAILLSFPHFQFFSSRSIECDVIRFSYM